MIEKIYGYMIASICMSFMMAVYYAVKQEWKFSSIFSLMSNIIWILLVLTV